MGKVRRWEDNINIFIREIGLSHSRPALTESNMEEKLISLLNTLLRNRASRCHRLK
jgi:hypothetical protein